MYFCYILQKKGSQMYKYITNSNKKRRIIDETINNFMHFSSSICGKSDAYAVLKPLIY